MRDITTALRGLRRSPGFVLTAVIAVALGIGAATTVFSVADHVLFRPLPYAQADRLVTLGADVRARGQSNWAVNAEEYDAWRQASRTLSDIGGSRSFGRFTLLLPHAPVEIDVTVITPNFLSVLGVSPAAGRPFGDGDFVTGAPIAMLLTDMAWHKYFGANRSAIGTFITVNGAPAEIAGVLPREFAFPLTRGGPVPDALIPLKRSSETTISMIGRLAPGASVEAARAEIDGIAASRKGESGMRNNRIDGATVMPLEEALSASPTVFLLLFGAVAALVLIGSVNVANLLLARGADRQGELAVRRALGATRGALARLLLVETALLIGAGCVLGAALAFLAVTTIAPLMPTEFVRLGAPAMDARALAFAGLSAVVFGGMAGLGPAFSTARVNLSPSLSQASSRSTGAGTRVRRVLVGVEVALAVVLLVGGGLMVGSMVRIMNVDAGYTPESRLTMRVQVPRGRESPEPSRAFLEQVLATASVLPGVTTAGATAYAPLGRTLYGGVYRVEGFPSAWMREGASNGLVCCTQTQYVSTNYFRAAGIPIVKGRALDPADAAKAPAVAVIGERLARKFPAGMDPIGRYLTAAKDGTTDRTDVRLIVGVVRDVQDMGLGTQALQAIYLPLEERGEAAMTLVMQTNVAPYSVAGAAEGAIRKAVGPVLITDVRSFIDLMKKSAGPRHLNAWLFGTFAALGLMLAMTGIASVVSYTVSRRTREMGLRMALGANPADVSRLVVRQSMTPVIVGLAVGIGAAVLLSRYVESLLFEVPPRDIWTYAGACVVLATSALLASLVPARRAARVDPLVALRAE